MAKFKDIKYDKSLTNPTCSNPLCQRGFIYGRQKNTNYDFLFKCKCSPDIPAPIWDEKYYNTHSFDLNPHKKGNEDG